MSNKKPVWIKKINAKNKSQKDLINITKNRNFEKNITINYGKALLNIQNKQSKISNKINMFR